MYYLQDLLTDDETDFLIYLCDSRQGWTQSPSRHRDDGADVSLQPERTSSSCPLIWPLLYLPHMEALRERGDLTHDMESEINFAW